MCATFESDHIVRIFDAGDSGHGPFLAMELLEGRSLNDYLETHGPLGPGELLRLAQQVGKGLDTANEAGVIHRDIKPQNLFLVASDAAFEQKSGDWQCKILDFGIARTISAGSTLTLGDVVLGTPAYMSPEQVQGLPADRRSDLHALVSVLYRALTGFAPFEGESSQAVMYAVVHNQPPPASSRVVVPSAIDAFFERGFAKDPDERFQSGEELALALAGAMSE
jgi:serine/threonine-protein kinase